MNNQYKDYPRAIREELEHITNNQLEKAQPKKKGSGCWRKFRLTYYLLLKKPSK